MEKELFDIDQLISNRFLGTITPDNDQLLDKWIGEKIENQRYFSEQKKLWELFTMHQKMQQIDEHKAFQKISAQLFTRKKRNILAYIQRIAAIMLIPVVIASSIYILSEKTERKQQATVYNTAETPLGMRSSLVLPDGTKVWLNSDTKIRYPGNFSKNQRDVYLDGEAFFEVSKNEHQPFVVHTSGVIVKVLGTKFNVKAYSDENQVEASLFEGKINLLLRNSSNQTVEKEVKPGQSFVYSKNKRQLVLNRFPQDEINGWKKNQLLFKDDTFGKLVRKIERWYNVELIYDEQQFNDRRLTVELYEGERLERLMDILSLALLVDYKYEKGKIILTPKSKNM